MAKKNTTPSFVDKLKMSEAKLQNPYKPQSLSGISQNARTNFSPIQANVGRYLTYGSKVYGQFGFDPTRDNDTFYNKHTTGSDDITRGFEGMFKLAKIGFQDTFALGAAKDKNSSFDFEKTMNEYSSTRGGGTQLFSNTLLSSGYTAGILGAIAAEEIGLSALTALTGGIGGAAQVAETGLLAARVGEATKTAANISKTLDRVKEASQIEKSRGFFGKVGDILNPVSNLTEFGKDIYKASKSGDKVSDLAKFTNGSAALVRDMRNVYMTHSESKLEAEMSQREFFNSEYEKKLMQSGTGVLDEESLSELKNKSQHVYNSIYVGNLGLIYATNKIGFDNLFKTAKGVNKYFNAAENGLYKTSVNKATGKIAVEALEKPIRGFRKYLVDKVKPFANWKTALSSTAKGALTNSMEGIQEIGQDMLAESTKSYFSRHSDVEQLKGGFLDQTFQALKDLTNDEFLTEDLVKAGKGMISQKGLETFLSGALMGTISSPVGIGIQGVNSFLFEGGRQNLKSRLMDLEGFQEAKANDFKSRKERAKVLTEFFNSTKTFTDFVNLPIIQQHQHQSDMLESARDNNNFDFKNSQAQAFAESMWTVMESGMHEEFKGNLSNMSNNFSIDELKQIFGREDITAENESEFRNKIQERATEVDSYKRRYDAIKSEFKNPISLGALSKDDPEFLDKYLTWKSYDSLQKESLVYGGMIEDSAKRINQLKEELSSFASEQGYKTTQFFNKDLIKSEVEMLKKTIASFKGIELNSDDRKRLDESEARYEKLSRYLNDFEKYETASRSRKKGVTKFEKILYESFKELIGDSVENEDKLKSTFEKLLDYVQLGHKNEFQKKQLDLISGIESRDSYAQAKKKLFEVIESNKETIISGYLKSYETKKASDEMLNSLYDQGLFFNLKELDDLLKDGQMPSQIFNVTTGKIATKEELIKAQDILKTFISNLKKLEVLEKDSTDTNKTGKRSKQDVRTVTDLLEQFDIKINSTINLSEDEGLEFLNAILDSDYSFSADETIVQAFLKGNFENVKVKFVNDSTQAIDFDSETGTYIFDLRYAGSEFNIAKGTSIESLTGRLLTQVMVARALDESSIGLLSKTMSEIKELLKDRLPVDSLEVFSNPEMFVSEILNNPAFQNILEGLSLSEAITTESAWDDMFESIQEYLGSQYESKALRKVLALIKDTFDGVIENPTETVSEDVIEESAVVAPVESDIESLTLENLFATYNVVNNEFQTMLAKLKEGNLKPKESRKLNRELVQKALEVNKIVDQIDKLREPEFDPYAKDKPAEMLSEDNGEILLDPYGNELVSPDTSWKNIPTSLKESLIEAMFPEVNAQTISKQQVLDLLTELKSNPVLQQILDDYNNQLTAQYETDRNQKVSEAKKEAVKERLEKERNQNKLINSRKRLVRNTLEKNIQKALGDDFSLLTRSELESLMSQFNSKNAGLSKFTMDDVMNFVKAKKLKLELNAKKQNAIRNQNIAINTRSLEPKKVGVRNTNNRIVKINLTPQLIEYIKRYNADIFALEPELFKEALNTVLVNYKTKSTQTIKYLKTVTSKETAMELFKKYGEEGLLFPDVVRTLNGVYRKLGIPYMIKRELKNTGVFYKLEAALKNAKARYKKPVSPRQKAIENLRNYIAEFSSPDNDLAFKAMVVDGLLEFGLSEELLKQIVAGNATLKSRMDFAKSKNGTVLQSRDGFSNRVIESSGVGDREFFKNNDAILQDYVDEIILNYKNRQEALFAINKLIAEDLDRRNELQEGVSNIPENYFEEEPSYSEISADEIEYYSSQEGIDYLSNLQNEQSSYYDSLEFKIQNGLYEGSYSDLTADQKELYSLAVAQGFYLADSVTEVQTELGQVRNELVQAVQENNTEKIAELNDQANLLESSITEALDAVEETTLVQLNDSPVSEEMVSITAGLPFTAQAKVKMFEKMIKDPTSSLTKLIALARVYSQDKTLSEKEMEKLDKLLKKALKDPNHYNQTTVVDNEIFWFNGVDGDYVLLVDTRYQRIEKSFDEFIKGFEKTPMDGEKVGGVTIDAVVNVQEIDYIKSTLNELFDTFGSEQETFKQKDLVQNLSEHFKTCK